MNDVKHVYFDVGGVALLDFSGTDKWNQMKRDLGLTQAQDEAYETVWQKYRGRVCLDCDVDHIIADFELATNTKFPQGYSMLSDFVNRFEKNESMWPVIQAAKQQYTIGLLTNMYPRMLNTIKAKQLLPLVEWNAIVDSSIVGYQKPEERIYQHAEAVIGVKPSEIFFIDNSEEHVAAAKKRGWQAMLYDPRRPIESSKRVSDALGLRI